MHNVDNQGLNVYKALKVLGVVSVMVMPALLPSWLKIIKLGLVTSLESQADDWLKLSSVFTWTNQNQEF